jgi:hypothetical protein
MFSQLASTPEIGGSDLVESSRSILQEYKQFDLDRYYQGHSLYIAYTGPRCYELQV